MGISLQKGQKIDLTKGGGDLHTVMVGLGWDESEDRSDLAVNIDCDASVILCGADGKAIDRDNMKASTVYFDSLRHSSGSVVHMGDNVTGEGDGDDEQIMVYLDKVPENIHRIVFVVNIFHAALRHQHFGMLKNAFIRLVDADEYAELCRFELNENYDQMTGLVVGEIYRRDNVWRFNAIGRALREASYLREIFALYV